MTKCSSCFRLIVFPKNHNFAEVSNFRKAGIEYNISIIVLEQTGRSNKRIKGLIVLLRPPHSRLFGFLRWNPR